MCAITQDGSLKECRIVGEQPAQLGFGEAALKLAGKFRAVTTNEDGDRTAGAFATFGVRFIPNGQSRTP